MRFGRACSRRRAHRLALGAGVALAMALGSTSVVQGGYDPDVSHPAVVASNDGTLDVFVRGQNNELVQRSWDGSRWTGWKNLGGDLTAAPSVTSSAPGRLDVFVRGLNGHLVYRFFERGRWSGWRNLGGDLTSSPAAVSTSPGRIDVFVRGLSGELVQRTSRDGRWGGWVNLGGEIASAPAVVSPGNNRFEVFARSPSFELLQRSFDGAAWGEWRSLGGDLTAAPAVATTELGRMHVLVRGLNGELVQRTWSGSQWSGWRNLGGYFTSAPAVVGLGGRLEVFARGARDQLLQRSFDGRAWRSWIDLGGDLRGRLRARLRLLTHNVYGLQGVWCGLRAKALGRAIATERTPFDVVALQEYYSTSDFDLKTCDRGHLSKSIWSTGRYRNSNNYYRHYPEVRFKTDGGVSIFTLHPIRKFDDWRWDNDSQGGLKAAEGFIFARIEIPGAGLTLDTYVVHLNSGGNNRQRRQGQLRQLARKIKQFSSRSGNPVVVLGDFNIGGPPLYRGKVQGNEGYEDILRALGSPTDLWLNARPRDNGFTFDCGRNVVAAATGCDSQYRIDYLFSITDPALTNSPYVVKLDKKFDANVVEWRVDPRTLSRAERALVDRFGGFGRRGPPHVSDHFGVEALIEVRER